MVENLGRVAEKLKGARSALRGAYDYSKEKYSEFRHQKQFGANYDDMRATVQEIATLTYKYANRIGGNIKDNAGPRIKINIGGGAAGAIVGWIIGGGAIGVVGLGMAVGIPVALVTAILGVVVTDYGYRELLPLIRQWLASANRQELARSIAGKNNDEQPAARTLEGSPEHRKYLCEAIERAEKCITIRSGFISTYAVDSELLKLVERALSRGVHIIIEYGYQYYRGMPEDQQDVSLAVERLKDVSSRFKMNGSSPLKIVRTPTHIKEVAIDDLEIAIGSFNWLENSDGGQELHANKSVVLRHAVMAAAVRQAAIEASMRFSEKNNR